MARVVVVIMASLLLVSGVMVALVDAGGVPPCAPPTCAPPPPPCPPRTLVTRMVPCTENRDGGRGHPFYSDRARPENWIQDAEGLTERHTHRATLWTGPLHQVLSPAFLSGRRSESPVRLLRKAVYSGLQGRVQTDMSPGNASSDVYGGSVPTLSLV